MKKVLYGFIIFVSLFVFNGKVLADKTCDYNVQVGSQVYQLSFYMKNNELRYKCSYDGDEDYGPINHEIMCSSARFVAGTQLQNAMKAIVTSNSTSCSSSAVVASKTGDGVYTLGIGGASQSTSTWKCNYDLYINDSRATLVFEKKDGEIYYGCGSATSKYTAKHSCNGILVYLDSKVQTKIKELSNTGNCALGNYTLEQTKDKKIVLREVSNGGSTSNPGNGGSTSNPGNGSSTTSNPGNNNSGNNSGNGNTVNIHGKTTYKAVYCGDADIRIPAVFPSIVNTLIRIIQIAVPVLLIFFGMFDLAKAVIAQKDEDIKKGQQTFVKRLIAGVLVFFVFFVVEFVVGIIAKDDQSVWNCVDCFVNGNCITK